MATRQGSAVNLQSTTAGLISWAAEIVATLTAGGWAQTADTGQTAAASLVTPGVANTSAGYQIWQMQDALQVAGSKVYVKFEFGEGATNTAPSLWITIGTGSDGAGNITGSLLARTQITSGGGTLSSSCTTYGSAATDRVSWMGGTSAGHLAFSIERTHDASGNDTNEGVLVFGTSNATAPMTIRINQYLRFTNNTLPSSTTLGAWCPTGASWSDSVTNNIGVCPVRFFNGSPSNPCLSWMVYMNGDQSAAASIAIQIWSASHTYMTLGTGVISTVASSNANSTFAMIWE